MHCKTLLQLRQNMCIIGICLWYDLGRILLDKQNANNCKCFKSNVICNLRCHGKAHNVKCLNQNWNKDIIQTAFLDLVALDFIILVLFTRSCFKFFHSAIKLFLFWLLCSFIFGSFSFHCSCFGCPYFHHSEIGFSYFDHSCFCLSC